MCGLELGKEATCYTKEDRIYCKTDYARYFISFGAHSKPFSLHTLVRSWQYFAVNFSHVCVVLNNRT